MSRLVLAATLLLTAPLLGAQEPGRDDSSRIRALLPVAESRRVHAAVEAARAAALPHTALELLALELAAKSAPPPVIAARVERRLAELTHARDLLADARGTPVAGDEIVVGAEALSRGVSGDQIAALARSAPGGRSLAIPLLVTTELMDRGLPSDDAIASVRARIAERAPDEALRGEALAAARRATVVPARAPIPMPRPEPQGRGRRPGR